MGTQGVAWDMPKSSIIEALKRNKGRLIASASDLNCSFPTIDKYIKQDPELVALLADLRRWGGHSRVDKAEDVLEKAMDSADTDIKAALSAAFYTLNTDDISRERGWGNVKREEIEATREAIDQLKLSASQQLELIELRAAKRASHNDSQASLTPPPEDSDTPQSYVQ